MGFTHLRSKYYKEEMHQHRERRFENDNLVLRILKIRGRNPAELDELNGRGSVSVRAGGSRVFNSARKSDPNFTSI